jgi:hypothetical protein
MTVRKGDDRDIAGSALMKRRHGHAATRRTVIIAGVANVIVGLVKLAAGI